MTSRFVTHELLYRVEYYFWLYFRELLRNDPTAKSILSPLKKNFYSPLKKWVGYAHGPAFLPVRPHEWTDDLITISGRVLSVKVAEG